MAVVDLSKLSLNTRIELANEAVDSSVLEELADLELSEDQNVIILLRIIANPNTSKETLQKIANNAREEAVRISVYRKM